ncbi:DUF1758 domain-containing protein [Trichonephila clavipes]|uniref:DUF1758 domain-containing protein n=1 Tax=Trichonephila clavipes TaxID=2585209 RepID=A0A8X6S5X2_TRICX|nr:DUF1758 domain-containing protein [Trichonephila clavipes]
MCFELPVNKREISTHETINSSNALITEECSKAVLLQTIFVNIGANGKQKSVRALIDSGSQNSHILKKTAEELGFVPASWVLMGRTSNNIKSTSQSGVAESITMLTHSEKIEHIWNLELLGIKEPTEKISREEVEKFFNDTLSTDFDGRYMISVHPKDRDFLRFFWWKDYEESEMKIYRHRRLVFGLSCRPFLLGAVINILLENCPQVYRVIAEILKKCLYGDYCVTSADTEELSVCEWSYRIDEIRKLRA